MYKLLKEKDGIVKDETCKALGISTTMAEQTEDIRESVKFNYENL